MKQSKFYKEQMDEENVNSCFDEIRNENYDNSFENFKIKMNYRIKSSSKLNLSDKFIYLLNLNKLKLTCLVLIALTIAACSYPVKSVDTLGYLISFNAKSENVSDISKQIGNMKIQNSYSLKVFKSSDNTDKFIKFNMMLQNVNEESSTQIKNDISRINGVENIVLTSLSETNSQPVYAYLLKNFMNLNVNPSDKSPEVLTEEINENLKKAGMINTNVKVVIENGVRRLILENSSPNDNFEIKLGDDKTMDVLKIKRLDSNDVNQGSILSEDELRKKVKTENPNLNDDDIKIIKEIDSNGKEVLKVEISKED
ncbi:MAG TPA: hypothetical protein PLG90_11900 [Ignavibacteria bacterium]|nr:hypothetical protein [Ignavibacteria bacterium]